jgi:hypothetical protein
MIVKIYYPIESIKNFQFIYISDINLELRRKVPLDYFDQYVFKTWSCRLYLAWKRKVGKAKHLALSYSKVTGEVKNIFLQDLKRTKCTYAHII